MDFSRLTLGDKILGGTAIALVITLVFLPWHSVSYSGYGVSYSATSSAIERPNGMLGLLALLVLFAIIGVTIVRKLTDTELPETPKPLGELTFYAAVGVLVILLLKVIVKTDILGFGCYLAILLAGGMVYGAYLGKDEADGAATGGGTGAPPTPF